MPLKQSSGGWVQYVKDRESKYLTSDEARYINKKVEQDDLINVETRGRKSISGYDYKQFWEEQYWQEYFTNGTMVNIH